MGKKTVWSEQKCKQVADRYRIKSHVIEFEIYPTFKENNLV